MTTEVEVIKASAALEIYLNHSLVSDKQDHSSLSQQVIEILDLSLVSRWSKSIKVSSKRYNIKETGHAIGAAAKAATER